MINGILYGLFFFSLIPSFVMVISGFDLSFYPEQSFQTKSYDVNFSLIYIFCYIILALILLFFLKKNPSKYYSEKLVLSILKLRKKSFIIKCLTYLVLTIAIVEFFSIDHNEHWLEREKLSLIPPLLRFYINPLFSFVIFLSIINLVSSFAIIRAGSLDFIRGWEIRIWVIIDAAIIFINIYNSGNRWYLAIMGLFYFYLSPIREKKLILLLSPLIIITAGMISIAVVANRVGGDVYDMISFMFNFENLSNAFLTAVMTVTEGFNITSLIMLADSALFNPDITYLIKKLFLLPLPASLVEKPLPFNQAVAQLFTGEISELSINTGIFGIFIYSFGIFSIVLFLAALAIIHQIEKNNNYSALMNAVWFCLFLAGYRFGFEFLLVHFIYFYVLNAFLGSKMHYIYVK